MRTRALAMFLCVLSVAADAAAQRLRRAVRVADAVVVARPAGIRPLGNDLFLHRFEVVRRLKGDPGAAFTLLEHKRLGDAPLPRQDAPRLHCLRPLRDHALPARHAPYFELVAYPGSQPVVEETAAGRDLVAVVALQVSHDRDRAEPGSTAAALLGLALRGAGPARLEACELLREEELLRAALDSAALADLLAAGLAERDDVERRVALLSLVVEAGGVDALDAICSALEEVVDPRHAQAVGRLVALADGKAAVERLRPRLARATGGHRDRVLLAIGATRVAAAADLLLALRRVEGSDPGLDRALLEHGSRRARLAVVGR